jgi:hypothetical protein
MARVPLTGGIPGGISRLRMPQIRHMKEVFRGGNVNPASGSIPAGTRVRFLHKPTAGKGRRS